MGAGTAIKTTLGLFAMSEGGKVVMSKRSARPYIEEDEMEKQTLEYQANGDERRSTASTSTTYSSQSSLESSPSVHAADPERDVEQLQLSSQKHRTSTTGPRDAFHPPNDDLESGSISALELDRILPTEGRPSNFGVVVPGVYRSSFPQSEDYGFIEGLKLKTIVTLVQKEFPQGYDKFIERNGINHCVFDMKGTKKQAIPIATMRSILRLVLDRRNHPLLIHCNHGKHRTGCVVGVVRKLSGWELGNVLSEYKKYAEPKVRDCDVNYITGFEPADISNLFREVTLPFRTRNFLRATFFALIMTVIWLFSGTKLISAAPQRGKVLEE
ncbi:tyrosine-protein phosphatase siw14 [Podospora pseudocomata]|uniref:Tyrosine-protein phosphatase siw14 n=1 Tax=Podospora pseudocomata TaxID=2093779 RepID=A0ABR0GJU9_9PEZI|nr:tyrosine-protein phosphatase siw14 [Podospora pseudocomata]